MFRRSTQDIVAGGFFTRLKKRRKEKSMEESKDETKRLDTLTPEAEETGVPAPEQDSKPKEPKKRRERPMPKDIWLDIAFGACIALMLVAAGFMLILGIRGQAGDDHEPTTPVSTGSGDTTEATLSLPEGSYLVAVPTADYLAAAKPGDLARIVTEDTAPGELQYLEIAAISGSSVTVYMTDTQLAAYLAVQDHCCLVLAAQGGNDAAKLLDYQARYNSPTITLVMAETSKSIPEGGKTLLDLEVAVEPEGAPTEAVVWSSSDGNIAMVDEDGTVTGLVAGTAEITASCGGQTAVCTVTVYPVATALTMAETADIAVGEELPLEAAVEPADINDTVRWTSSDEAVATVSTEGVVTGVSAGDCEITAICGGKSATCKIAVKPLAERIVLDTEALTLAVGGTGTLHGETTPADAAGTISWASSDETVATVDQAGTVTALKAGTCQITVSCGGVSAVCIVTVQ